MCHCVLVNNLTEKLVVSEDGMKETERDFFNSVVAERFPDLIVDICDYWLN